MCFNPKGTSSDEKINIQRSMVVVIIYVFIIEIYSLQLLLPQFMLQY